MEPFGSFKSNRFYYISGSRWVFFSLVLPHYHEWVWSLQCSHLVDLLLVQVKNLSGGGGGNLLIRPVARLRAVPAVPGQHKYHLGNEGGRRVKRITTVRCLLSTGSLTVGCKLTLMLIVMLRADADTE